jgi:hypothetical protein
MDASKEGHLEVNTEIAKRMLMSHHQTSGQNYDIKTSNRSFGNLVHFKYFGMTETNKNLIQEDFNLYRTAF